LPNSDVKLREIINENIRKTYGDHPDPAIPARIEQELKGIIENGYSVTYYIAHCIIKKANEEGYIVGSRGSVGSSFAATMSGITEVNPLAPHYLCHKCHHFEWSNDPKDQIRL
jgi:DNA polymerase-3 subunit alpha (Gram-positive type)